MENEVVNQEPIPVNVNDNKVEVFNSIVELLKTQKEELQKIFDESPSHSLEHGIIKLGDSIYHLEKVKI
jgi:hypothetical protein